MLADERGSLRHGVWGRKEGCEKRESRSEFRRLLLLALFLKKTKAKINPRLLAFLNCNSNCKLGECVTECRERVRVLYLVFAL